MVKLTKEQELELKLKQQLNNFNPSEVESYLLALLEKCLAAAERKDYLALGSVEELLNRSIVILASKVKNFNLMYTNLRLKAVTKYLAKYIEVDNAEAFNFINVLPEFVTLEEAELIANTKDYENYSYAKRNLKYNYELFNNEKYSILYNNDSLLILEKGTDSKIAFESWDGDLEIFERFITGSNSNNETIEVISLMQHEKESERAERVEKIYPYIMEFFKTYTYFNFTEGNILYFKENPSYMAIVTSDYFLFIYEKETGLFNTFTNFSYNIKENIYRFLDYCLGVPTEEEAKVPEAKVIEVYNVLINVLINSIWDMKGLIKLYNENPSDEHYKLIDSKFFRNEEQFNLIWYLLEEPYISENVDPEVIKEVHENFKEYSSVTSEVLEIAKEYNRQHKEEYEEIHERYLRIKKQEEYLGTLTDSLF